MLYNHLLGPLHRVGISAAVGPEDHGDPHQGNENEGLERFHGREGRKDGNHLCIREFASIRGDLGAIFQ